MRERSGALAVAVLLACFGPHSLAANTQIRMDGSSGTRLIGQWALDRHDKFNAASETRDVDPFSLFAERAFPWQLREVDIDGATSGRDWDEHVTGGVGWTRHSDGNNYSMHANFSRYFDPMRMKYGSGSMTVLGYSTEVGLRRDILYANGYWTEGDFRRPASGGTSPLGPAGRSGSGVDLGGHHPALWPRPLDSAGFAVGMQRFFADDTVNWTVELGHRQDFGNDRPLVGDAGGTALNTQARYKISERLLLQLDAYYAIDGRDSQARRRQEDYHGQNAENVRDSSALRVELRVNF